MVTAKKLQSLESYVLEAQTFLNANYPSFRGRDKNEGYFNLYVKDGWFKHTRLYDKWYKKVMRTLTKDFRNMMYITKFSRTRYPSGYTLLGADGFYKGLAELEVIAEDARAVYDAERHLRAVNTSKTTANYTYESPYLYLHLLNDRYPIHQFRKGKPKAVLEYTLNKPSLSVQRSEFRSGGLAGFTVKEPFDTLFRQLLKLEVYQIAKLNNFFVELTPSKIRLSESPFTISTLDARKIHQQFTKSE